MTISILVDNKSRQGCFFRLYYNENLTKDSNKGIANISWNSLNLPNVVSFSDGSTVTYTYAADGTKLRTVHNINGTTTQTDYCGSAFYENGIAKFWQTEAGHISMDDSKYHYYYESGHVVESIKVISHSMGGSFAKDYINALLKYFKDNNLKDALITLEADFDPFQANTLSVIDNVFTQQFTHNRVFEGDYWYLANKKQEGLKHYYNDKEQGSHSITSFFNDISKLKEGTYIWDGENWILQD